jgi:WD40 repeat protein
MLILSGHTRKVHTLAFAPDGRTLASVAGHDTRIWLWDLEKAQPVFHAGHKRRVVSLAFAPCGGALACADSSGGVVLWDLASSKERMLDVVSPIPNQPVRVVFAPDSVVLAATTGDDASLGFSRLPRPHNGVILWDWNVGGEFHRVLRSRLDYLTCLAFSPEGKTLAAGSLDFSVYLWDLTGDPDPTPLNHGRKVHFVAYSPDGRTLASASPDGLVKIWDAHTGTKRTTLKGQGKFLHAIAYSPDGRSLATAAGDGSVRFWEVSTGRALRGFDWGIGPVHSVAFAPDGMRAAAGGERDIVVWDLDDWG